MCGRIVKGKGPDISFGPPSVKQINTWLRRMIESGERTLGSPLFPPEEALGTTGYNIAPTQQLAFLREGKDGREVLVGRWGLDPVHLKSLEEALVYRKERRFTFNARDDSLHKAIWKFPANHRRCVVPISGFYEWQQIEGEEVKQPWFNYRADHEPLVLAGLYMRHEWGDSFAIVTASPNTMMESIHNRMPVVLVPESLDRRMDPATKDVEQVRDLIGPCPNEWLATHKVSGAVGNTRNDHPERILPLAS